MTIRSDWQRSTIPPAESRIDFARSFEDESKVLAVGAHQRRKVAYDWLKSREGTIDLRTMTDLLRQHPEGFDPVEGEVCTNICMHAGPHPNRFWQACGAMITESSERGAMAWVTATSGTCVSVFKPLYFGVAMPDTGPTPTESFTDDSLWWKHEKLHRRAMADFHVVGPKSASALRNSKNDGLPPARRWSPPVRLRRRNSCPNVGEKRKRQPTNGSRISSDATSRSSMRALLACGTV